MEPKKNPQQKWREKNPTAYWAHRATASALRSGLIEKAPCQKCGDPESEAHHVDYCKPLHIRWLCRRCHKAEHAAMRKVGAQ